MYDHVKPCSKDFESRQSNYVLNHVYSDNGSVYHQNLFPEYLKIKKENLGITPSLRDYLSIPFWNKDIGISDFSKINFNNYLKNESEFSSQLFHYPISVNQVRYLNRTNHLFDNDGL